MHGASSFLWSKGWIGTPKAKREKHRGDVRSRQIINAALVVIAITAAFGWNLAITHNDALVAPASAVTAKGADFAATTGSEYVPPGDLERLLVSELRVGDKWIVPFPSFECGDAEVSSYRGIPRRGTPTCRGMERTSYLTVESVWSSSASHSSTESFALDVVEDLNTVRTSLDSQSRVSWSACSFASPERWLRFTTRSERPSSRRSSWQRPLRFSSTTSPD